MPKSERGPLTFGRRIMRIPLKFKKTYAEIFLKDLMIYTLIFGDFTTKSKKILLYYL